ncbi:MAG: sigma-70 family RNA polymerase sigma factor [Planctomycetes bacterium]|nr:sigma-70 family RNA polymerase sigma factor [Planctomycetota bacterium]
MSIPPQQPDLDQLFADADWLRRLALRLAGSEERAEELVQETWLAALNKSSDLSKHPRSWLASVARNLHFLGLRREARRRKRERDFQKHSEKPLEDSLLRVELQRQLTNSLFALDESARTILIWKYFDQMSNKQIAERMGLDTVLVRQRMSRARKRLRLQLQSDFGPKWRQRLLIGLPTAQLTWKVVLGGLFMNAQSKITVGLIVLLGITTAMFWDGGDSIPELGQDDHLLAQVNSTSASESLPNMERSAVTDSRENVPHASAWNDNWLHGQVVDHQGKPVALATVSAILPTTRQIPGLTEYWISSDLIVASLQTDPEGKFEFDLSEKRVYDLTVQAAGFANLRAFDHIAGESLVLRIEPSAVVTGKVIDKDMSAAIEGAILRLTPGYPRAGKIRYEAVSDSDGKYSFTDMPSGSFSLVVESETHPSPRDHAFFEFPPLNIGEFRQLDISLQAGVPITGRVTHAELQTPIAGAKVKIGLLSGRAEVETDSDGYFELFSAVGNAQQNLCFRADGFGSFSVELRHIPKEGKEVFVALLPARKAVGRVVDSNGLPIAGAQVCAHARGSTPPFGEQIEDLRTTTDSNGVFEIKNVRQDLRHSILLAHPEYATEVYDFPADEWQTQQIDLGDLLLEQPASIQGRVTNADGVPLPQLWVLLNGEPAHRDDLGPVENQGVGYASDEGVGFGRISARTDSAGRFLFSNLPSGDYQLSAGAKGYLKRGNLQLSLNAGEQRQNIEISFDPGLSIQGVVTDVQGNRRPGASVTIFKAGTYQQLVYSICNPSGEFAVWGLPAGEYSLAASSGFGNRTNGRSGVPLYYEVYRESVAAGVQDLKVVLPDLGQIRGKILDPDGQRLQGALVGLDLNNDGAFHHLTASNEMGEFVLLVPVETPYTIMAHPATQIADGVYRWILDENRLVDTSYFQHQTGVRAGSQEVTIQLTKLLPLSGE